MLELGCGPSKRIPGAIGLDLRDFDGVDIVADLNEGMEFLPDSSVDEIHSFSFLEHLNDLSSFMMEIYRVLKPGGLFAGRVPHYANPYYSSDPTHKSRFGLYTFCYFSKSHPYARRVPQFYNQVDFEINVQRLVFKSEFPVRQFLKTGVQLMVNSSRWLLEWYEENMVWIYPPYEIDYQLIKCLN